MGRESGGCIGWLVAQAGGVGFGCERVRWSCWRRAGGVLLAVALLGTVLVLSERVVVAQSAPSVSVSAGAAGALEGDVLLFTVTLSVPVEGNRGSALTGYGSSLGVRVLVVEDGNVDVDGDGTPEAGSGVLQASQEGERGVGIPPGELEVVVAVETVGAAGSGSVTVTVTVLEPDGGEYAVAPVGASASTVVRDDGADAVVFWSAADSEPILAAHPVELVEDERLDVAVRVVTDGAVAPQGHFSLQVSVDAGTAARHDYEELDRLVHFGSGSGAHSRAAPFSLTGDGLRYTAAAPVRFFTTNDAHYELAESLDLVVERTEGVPATVRLAAGSASRLPILLFDNDYAEADIVRVEPGDGTLTVTWEYAREAGPFVQQTELQWRRSGETTWPADGTGLLATGTSAEIPGLDNGVEYELRARPIVPDGRSLWPYGDYRLGTGTPRGNTPAPSVGVSATATEATEGGVLRFTVRAGAPVSADLNVVVVVGEDGNIDTDADGTPDAGSGVLPAAQEGSRSVTIPAGASEAVLSVLTAADEVWENHATVTVTVSAPDGGAYTVDAAAGSASTRVVDDDVPVGEISLSVSQVGVSVGESDNIVIEGHGVLGVQARFVTDGVEEPHGFFGVRMVTFPGTTDYDFVAVPLVLSFGSGDGAPAGAVPFTLSDDGLRYEAVATGFVEIVNDALFELNETFEIALERTPSLPASVRLGAGDASRVTVTIVNDDIPRVYFDERGNPPVPGDGQLTVSWEYGDDRNDYVTQFAVRWRRSDGTPQSEDREWGAEGTEQIVAGTPGLYTDEGTIDIVGLENGVLYEVGVRPVVEIGNYQIGLWQTITGTPRINFRLVGAVLVDGRGAIELVYDSVLDESLIPPVDAFSVSADGVTQTISAVAVLGRVVTLALASPVVSPTATVTVSYTSPAATDTSRIQTTGGDAAAAFADQPVTIPQDPPTITSVESPTGGLAISWSPVAGISGYDLAWRQDTDPEWQSTRIGIQQQDTIGDLSDGALYWVRIRAVKTAGALTDQAIYVTGWSTAEPGIAGDWAPQNVEVTPGDRMVTVTWDTVAGADDYEFQWQPNSEAASDARSDGGGGSESSKQARSGSATSRNVLEPPPATDTPAWSPVPFEADASRGSATVTGLDNGEDYSVRVRALRRVQVDPGAATERTLVLYSGWFEQDVTPALAFETHGEPSGPRVVWSGGRVLWEVTLRHEGSLGPTGYQPFANQPIAAFVTKGPSTGAPVRCVLDGADDRDGAQGRYGDCITDAEGKVKLEYRAASVRTDAAVGVDELAVFADYDSDGRIHKGELSTESEVGSTKIARPINLVALGDSYSSGQNGKPRLDRSRGFTGYYLSESGTPATAPYLSLTGPVDAPCRRWTNAYSQRLPGLHTSQPLTYGDQLKYSDQNGFWACEGAISLNIEHVPRLNPAPSAFAYLLYRFSVNAANKLATADPLQVRRPSIVATDRPSHSYEVEAGEQDRERRQIDSLRSHLGDRKDLSGDVDMIVLTIGGNDIGFSRILEQCIIGTCFGLDESLGLVSVPFDPQQYSLTYHELAEAVGYYFETIFAELDTRLDSVFSELSALKSNPANIDEVPSNASMFVLGYPHLVPSESDIVRNCGSLGLLFLEIDKREREFLRRGNLALNARIKGAAERAGLHFVPVVDAFAGHEPCTSEEWVNGLEFDVLGEFGPSGRSFHPNQLGHRAYAEALLGYIDDAIDAAIDDAVAAGADLDDALDDALNAAGLPGNPSAAGESGARGLRSARARGVSGAVGETSSSASEGQRPGDGGSEESAEGSSVVVDSVVRDVLVPRRLVPVTSSCGAEFVSRGEVVVLSASGFAAGTSVAVAMRSAVAPWATVSESSLLAATADTGGGLEVRWTAPTPEGESVPWAYAFEASGAGASGGTLVARSLVPVVVYPGVAPCAVGDAAATTVGEAVRVAVLGNDVAPAGGSLVAASVSVAGVEGASVSVDATDGAVTVAPGPGFVGTIVVPYRVADSWGVRVGAPITVTVDAGCTIAGTAGVEHIEGTGGDDVICVPDRDDRDAFHTVDAKGGDDVILGGAGVEWVDAGAGSDVVYGGGGADRLDGGPGIDTIYGGAGLDTIRDDDLVDSIVDDPDGYELLLTAPGRGAHVAPIAHDDAAYASAGETLDVHVLANDHDPNQNLVVTSLSITGDPTLGAAHVVVGDGGGVWVRYVAGSVGGVDSFAYEVCDSLDDCSTGEVTVTVGTAGCTIVGSDGDDELHGTAGADVICGLGGDDVIYGLGGDDVLVGGAGDDVLYGGDGDDTLHGGDGDDDLFGGSGEDALWGAAGGDALEGNSGDDVLSGGPGVDGLIGGGGADTLWGGAGDDSLIGHAGDDALHGGGGNDVLVGGVGADVLWGGDGDDTLTGSDGADTLWGGPGADLLWGNSQNDTLHGGSGIDILRGGGGDDRLGGGAGDDQLHGNAGDDRLWGGSGVDSLDGGNGADYIDGGDDADTCARGETVARCET